MPPADRTLSSRFECKYWVPEALVPAVRATLRPFMRPDRFSARSPSLRYWLTSLYVDSPLMDLMRSTTEGHKNRFKLRIRSYTDDPQVPLFFEIKRRVNQVVLKRRAAVPRDLALRTLTGEVLLSSTEHSSGFEEFIDLARSLDARPVCKVRYSREAYESRGGDPVRITFDRELHYGVTREWDFSIAPNGYRPVPMPGTIIEVKFTDMCPSWVEGLVGRFELHRTSIPKYVMAVERAVADGRLVPHRMLGARRAAGG